MLSDNFNDLSITNYPPGASVIRVILLGAILQSPYLIHYTWLSPYCLLPICHKIKHNTFNINKTPMHVFFLHGSLSSLIQEMTLSGIGAKPLHEPALVVCYIDYIY